MILISWQLLIGLGIFIFGMHQLESGIQGLSATHLKRWIANSTRNPISSCGTGIGITAILQSSSMVSLLVLAFASAGMLPLLNAISVILGANLGTTATGWLVATIGFKLNLEALALPLFAFGGLSMVIFNDKPKVINSAKLCSGLGILLFGLVTMKDSVSELSGVISIESLHGHSVFIYFLVGILITTLIQSSSATMMLTLTALHSDIITLYYAAALIIGADLGTTSTTILASLTGNKVKKQLAFAHVFFNFFISMCALFLFLPIYLPVLEFLDIKDSLFSLVGFHSFMNLFGLIVFLPLIKKYTAMIESLFKSEQTQQAIHIPIEVPDAAIPALNKFGLIFLYKNIHSQLAYFNLDYQKLSLNGSQLEIFQSFNKVSNPSKTYLALKNDEAELLKAIIGLQKQSLTSEQSLQTSELLQVIRSIMYATKTIKDVHHNLQMVNSDSDSSMKELYKLYQQSELLIKNKFIDIINHNEDEILLDDELAELKENNNSLQEKLDKFVYENLSERSIMDEVSSLLNINRELHHANKIIITTISPWMKFVKQCTNPEPKLAAIEELNS